jgi:ectoine hydroxylase-related dioxygenase (phytanoyl-CoA dioxygenase family)
MAESLPRLQAENSTATEMVAEMVAALNETGAAIVDGLLSDDIVCRFNAEIDGPLEAADSEQQLVNPLIGAFFGAQTRHLTGVCAKSRIFAEEVLCDPLLLGICDAILLPSCARYQLNVAHVLDRGPGSPQQFLHRDELVWSHLPRPHAEVQVASVIALEEFSASNGATRVVPGSHRWPLERQAEPGELVAAEMQAGSAIIYLGSTIHGGGPNTTADRRRRGMHLSYTLGWLRTEENHYLSTPPDVARTLSRQAQELLGYAAHDAIATGGGYLGTVDTRDPLDMLETGEI